MTTFEEDIAAANVLLGDKKYKAAIDNYADAVDKTTIPEQQIDVYNAMGRLYLSLENVDEAIGSFEKSLEIYESLPDFKVERLKVNKATILNNLGAIKIKTNVKQAIKHHKEALGIFKKASEKTPENFSLHLANTQYSYGDASYAKGDYYMAKKQFKDAIITYKSLKENASVQPLVANAHYNLANIYTDEDNVHDARSNYLNALKLFKALSEGQPEAYRSLVGATYNNLAVTAKTMYQYSDAITYYENALKEYEYLIDLDRTTFLPFYAATLSSIGIIYSEQHEVKDDYDSFGLSGFSGFGTLTTDNSEGDKTKKQQLNDHRKEKGESYYLRALEIYNELVIQEPESYMHYLATCFHNLGILYDGKKDYKIAEEYYEKALTIRRDLAKQQPEAFNLDVCVTLLNVVTMYQILLEQTIEMGFKTESLKILKEITERLSVYGEDTRPIILSMKSDTEYFTKYFNDINEEYLDIFDALVKADAVTEKITEIFLPSEKLELQKHILNLIYGLYEKFPKNKRLQDELLGVYIQYSWFALRANEITLAEVTIENGFKIKPDSLPLKANQGHLFMLKNENEKARNIYNSIKDLLDEDNESFSKILKADLTVLTNDGVLKFDIDSELNNLFS